MEHFHHRGTARPPDPLKTKSRLGARKGRQALISLTTPHSTYPMPRRRWGLGSFHTVRMKSGPLLKVTHMQRVPRVSMAFCWPRQERGPNGATQQSPYGGVSGKGTTYRAVPKSSSRVEGGPHLVTLCDPVGDGLQFSHGLLVLEVIGEGFCPLL